MQKDLRTEHSTGSVLLCLASHFWLAALAVSFHSLRLPASTALHWLALGLEAVALALALSSGVLWTRSSSRCKPLGVVAAFPLPSLAEVYLLPGLASGLLATVVLALLLVTARGGGSQVCAEAAVLAEAVGSILLLVAVTGACLLLCRIMPFMPFMPYHAQ